MSTALANIKNETLTKVENQIAVLQREGGLSFPQNYSVGNALKSAWLILQETVDKDRKPALEVCTKESIYLSLLDMTIQGLSAAKKQGYFIVYGKKLQFMRSYFGTMAVTKRLPGVKDINAQVIYEGDEFDFEIQNGVKRIVKHKQTLESIDPFGGKIKGAYCVITKDDGSSYTEIMPWHMIQKSWSKSKMSSNSVQKDFAEDMARRTVINRACKYFVNTSDDSDLIIDSFDRSDERTPDEIVEMEVEQNANSIQVDFEVQTESEPEKLDDMRKPDF